MGSNTTATPPPPQRSQPRLGGTDVASNSNNNNNNKNNNINPFDEDVPSSNNNANPFDEEKVKEDAVVASTAATNPFRGDKDVGNGTNRKNAGEEKECPANSSCKKSN